MTGLCTGFNMRCLQDQKRWGFTLVVLIREAWQHGVGLHYLIIARGKVLYFYHNYDSLFISALSYHPSPTGVELLSLHGPAVHDPCTSLNLNILGPGLSDPPITATLKLLWLPDLILPPRWVACFLILPNWCFLDVELVKKKLSILSKAIFSPSKLG